MCENYERVYGEKLVDVVGQNSTGDLRMMLCALLNVSPLGLVDTLICNLIDIC